MWEPRRVVPTYAVPVEDVSGEITPATLAPLTGSAPAGDAVGVRMPDHSQRKDLGAVARTRRADGLDPAAATGDHDGLASSDLVQERGEGPARFGGGHGPHDIRLS